MNRSINIYALLTRQLLATFFVFFRSSIEYNTLLKKAFFVIYSQHYIKKKNAYFCFLVELLPHILIRDIFYIFYVLFFFYLNFVNVLAQITRYNYVQYHKTLIFIILLFDFYHFNQLVFFCT